MLAAVYLFTLLFAPELMMMGASALVLMFAGLLTIALSLLMGRYVTVFAMPVTLAAMLVINLMGVKPALVINGAMAHLTAADGRGQLEMSLS